MKFSCDNIVVVCRMPFLRRKAHYWDMMTSSNGNIFHFTGPFVRRILRSPMNSPHKGQWRGALMFLWSAPCINGWVNNREAGDLIRHRAHYDAIVMIWCSYDEIRKMITKMLSLQWNDNNQHSMYIIVIWYLLGIITRQVFLIHALAWKGVLVIVLKSCTCTAALMLFFRGIQTNCHVANTCFTALEDTHVCNNLFAQLYPTMSTCIWKCRLQNGHLSQPEWGRMVHISGLGRVHKSWVRVRVRVLCLAWVWVRVRVLKKCVSTSTSTLVWVRVRVRVLHIQSTKFMSISLTGLTFFHNNLLSNFAGISSPLY